MALWTDYLRGDLVFLPHLKIFECTLVFLNPFNIPETVTVFRIATLVWGSHEDSVLFLHLGQGVFVNVLADAAISGSAVLTDQTRLPITVRHLDFESQLFYVSISHMVPHNLLFDYEAPVSGLVIIIIVVVLRAHYRISKAHLDCVVVHRVLLDLTVLSYEPLILILDNQPFIWQSKLELIGVAEVEFCVQEGSLQFRGLNALTFFELKVPLCWAIINIRLW